MKISVVGANSFIARNVIHILQKEYKNIQLFLYDVAEKQADNVGNYKKINILDKESVKLINFDVDILYMFVGKTGSVNGFDEFDVFLDINEKGLLNVLNEYRYRNSLAKIIFPSTRLVYKGKKGLQKEDDEKEFKTVYAINKYAGEKYLEQYNRVYNVQYCVFRICIPYGTLIPNATSYGTADFMIKKAKSNENISLYGDGSVRRTLTYMGDLCKVLIEGAINPLCSNDVYNVGGENYSLKEMAEEIAPKFNVGIDFVPWPDVALAVESGDTVFDDKKLREMIGNLTTTKFKEWVKENL